MIKTKGSLTEQAVEDALIEVSKLTADRAKVIANTVCDGKIKHFTEEEQMKSVFTGDPQITDKDITWLDEAGREV